MLSNRKNRIVKQGGGHFHDLDPSEVKKADILFMNLDGRVPDEGACVELGIAIGSGKRCYGFKTDTRSIELGLDLNPMISGCMIKVFKNNDGEQLIREKRIPV
ncbi:MAG: nucleoside 2-deoxyribosyltransferase [Mogibacterium sp.]|nr:nucleoside 2-deoxyribosyltransferase [Mogibacterium sp.]